MEGCDKWVSFLWVEHTLPLKQHPQPLRLGGPAGGERGELGRMSGGAVNTHVCTAELMQVVGQRT